MARLKTDWIAIATAGPTIDGRQIEAQWLTDAAKCYNRDEYTAMIWPYHESPYWRAFGTNFGEVDELKTETRDGKIQLMARLIPNQFLIEANRSGQKLFTSVEIVEDYLGSGKYFLKGLAVTDTPASIGTTRLQFSQENPGAHHGNVEALILTLPGDDTDSAAEQQARRGFFSRLFSQETPAPHETAKATPMDEKQFNQVMDAINLIGTRVETMEKSFADASPSAATAPTPPQGATSDPAGNDGGEGHFASQEQLEQLATAIESLSKKMDDISQTFADLQGDNTPLPNGNPSGDESINLV